MIEFLKESLFHTKQTANSENRLQRLASASLLPDENFYKFGETYFDGGEGALSYGVYKYDGRYKECVEKIVAQFGLKKNSHILELGCAKGFILYEFYKLGFDSLYGIDVSEYAVSKAPEAIKSSLRVGSASDLELFLNLPNSFDFILAKEMLPHLTDVELNDLLEYLPRVTKPETVVYLEIQTAKNIKGLKSIKKYDPTHKLLRTPNEWMVLLNERMRGIDAKIQVFLKELF